MSKTPIKPPPDNPAPKPAEAACPVAPELTERDHFRFRWSLLAWLAGFVFVWMILIIELARALFGMIRHAFGGG